MWYERSATPFRIVQKSYARYKNHGFEGMMSRLDKEYYRFYPVHGIKVDPHKVYKRWIEKNEQDAFKTEALTYIPLISIITPTYNSSPKYFSQMIASVLEQTYPYWELCIADDASSDKKTLQTLHALEGSDARIKITYRDTNGHISAASNSALELATGAYVTFLDHDDMLAPNALYEMVKKLNENRKLKFIYSDEDKMDEHNNRYNPHFKSGWNREMFFSQNYICHLSMIKKETVDGVGGFRVGYEGSQDYDLFLRVLKQVKEHEIDRVEKVLYHWRAIKGSTAYGSGEKEYAHEAGKRALQDYFDTLSVDAKVEGGLLPNTYKMNYALTSYPLVSLLIPTRDGYDVLHKCIESILEKTVYPNYEIIILDNETKCEKTLEYFEKIKKHKQIKIIAYHYPFNYSAINNFGVQHAKGEIVGLINNDVELISKGWLSEMVSYALLDGVGAVGAKLYYDNDTIQHAGVVLGIGGVAGHSHKYFDKNADGYFSRLKIVQNFSAVTGACLLVRKRLYEEVGGLDEENLTVAFNDVDFCLKLQEKGYRNIWTPYAELYHHESVSRGAEDNPEKVKRFNAEVAYMKNRWKVSLLEDVFYNKNLSDTHEDFGLRIGS